MNTRNSIIGWSLALLLIVGFGIASLVILPRGSAAQTDTESRKRISVTGRGEVKVTPDIAYVTIGVNTNAADAKSALSDNNAKMNALIEQLKAAGIAEADIQTTNLNISPSYDYSGNTPVLKGYDVINSVRVKVSVSDAGGLLDKVVEVGANNISGLSFDVADPAKSLEAARQAAIKDAQLRAEQYAAVSNAQVGEVLVISETVTPVTYPVAFQESRDMAAGSGAPIQPGQQSQVIEVQVIFELK
ncbi:SIMPL domain-containing protein [Herpetosiphon llansteffanensis]|uniref:SIMPL domain-containing protein n=1 Tax=Herpetosiphon llansteffanensis TaxID=2094568 RepID=UPI000D7CF36E|nr:SIMPL domain-containing protein [Herpetosiphon llansteffanensis]